MYALSIKNSYKNRKIIFSEDNINLKSLLRIVNKDKESLLNKISLKKLLIVFKI